MSSDEENLAPSYDDVDQNEFHSSPRLSKLDLQKQLKDRRKRVVAKLKESHTSHTVLPATISSSTNEAELASAEVNALSSSASSDDACPVLPTTTASTISVFETTEASTTAASTISALETTEAPTTTGSNIDENYTMSACNKWELSQNEEQVLKTGRISLDHFWRPPSDLSDSDCDKEDDADDETNAQPDDANADSQIKEDNGIGQEMETEEVDAESNGVDESQPQSLDENNDTVNSGSQSSASQSENDGDEASQPHSQPTEGLGKNIKRKKLSKKEKLEMRKETERLLRVTSMEIEPAVVRRDLGQFLEKFLPQPIPSKSLPDPPQKVEKVVRKLPKKYVPVEIDDSDDDICVEEKKDPTTPTSFIKDLEKTKKGKALAKVLSALNDRQKLAENATKPKNTIQWLKKAALESRIAEIEKRKSSVIKEVSSAESVEQNVEEPNDEHTPTNEDDMEQDTDAEPIEEGSSDQEQEDTSQSADNDDDQSESVASDFEEPAKLTQESNDDKSDEEENISVRKNTKERLRTVVDDDDDIAPSIDVSWVDEITPTAPFATGPAKTTTNKSNPVYDMFLKIQGAKKSQIADDTEEFSTLKFKASDFAEVQSEYQENIAATKSGDISYSQIESINDFGRRLESSQESFVVEEHVEQNEGKQDVKLKRLIRAAEVISSSEDEEEDEDEEQQDDNTTKEPDANTDVDMEKKQFMDAFRKEPINNQVKKQEIRPAFVEAEAEVEDDEFMNLGGADGDLLEAENALKEELATFIDEDTETIRTMTLTELEDLMKQDEKVRLFFNEQLRAKDLKDTKELVKDITTGKILDKRKHKNNGDTSKLEKDKFGRAEEDEEEDSAELRELDEASSYGVFADVIAKYISIRKEVHRKNMLRKRKRGQEAMILEANMAASTSQNADDAEFDWTNEGNVGEIQLAPGQIVETDLDKLEERIKKRAAIRRLQRQEFEAVALSDDDEAGRDEMIDKMLMHDHSKSKQHKPPTTPNPRMALITKTTSFMTSEHMKDVDMDTLNKYRASIGLTEFEMKSVNVDFVAKNRSGFAGRDVGKKTSAFSVSKKSAAEILTRNLSRTELLAKANVENDSRAGNAKPRLLNRLLNSATT